MILFAWGDQYIKVQEATLGIDVYKRQEVYAAVYDRALNVKRAIAADIVDENSYL